MLFMPQEVTCRFYLRDYNDYKSFEDRMRRQKGNELAIFSVFEEKPKGKEEKSTSHA